MSPARAREPFVTATANQVNVPVNSSPLAVKHGFDDGVNEHFRHPSIHQAHDISPTRVNLRLCSPVVRVKLSGANDGWFGWFYFFMH
jgi:hypothetical protein